MESTQVAKAVVAQAAIETVFEADRDSVVLGIGTGSTTDEFIKLLPDYRHKIDFAVSSSERSTEHLRTIGLTVVDPVNAPTISFYVDGADEIDPSHALTKGGGGALTKEKIVANLARVFVCIADESKLVTQLGCFPIPVEVLPFARGLVANEVGNLGGAAKLRDRFTTDNGNQILDVSGLVIDDPDTLETQLNQIPGVVSNGIFAQRRPDIVLVADARGARHV